ncbi:pyroglutamyl-peptidase I [Glutamicibacter sp. X7]
MRILVTGFEPFGQDTENASWEAVRRLPARIGAHEIVTGLLPVSFGRVEAALDELIVSSAAEAVVAVGEAGGRTAITPELWGVNEQDARIADNDGAQPRATAIDDGPARRGAGLDVRAMVNALQQAGFAAELSEDAGRFLCNQVAYLVAEAPGAFIHVPAVRTSGMATVGAETDSAPRNPGHGGYSFERLSDGLRTALGAL